MDASAMYGSARVAANGAITRHLSISDVCIATASATVEPQTEAWIDVTDFYLRRIRKFSILS
jgi:hypothetical protein